jgi:hypothetical protein
MIPIGKLSANTDSFWIWRPGNLHFLRVMNEVPAHHSRLLTPLIDHSFETESLERSEYFILIGYLAGNFYDTSTFFKLFGRSKAFAERLEHSNPLPIHFWHLKLFDWRLGAPLFLPT